MGNRIKEHYQAIIPSYRFNCSSQTCGNITEWGVDIYYESKPYTLDLQVWRPSPTVNTTTGTNCYSLVGNNRFVSISPSHGVVVVTPSPQDYIQFQPGDVLGFYVEEARKSQYGVVYLTNSYHTSSQVWLTSVEPTVGALYHYCPYSHNEAWSLLQAAPVISISIGNR